MSDDNDKDLNKDQGNDKNQDQNKDEKSDKNDSDKKDDGKSNDKQDNKDNKSGQPDKSDKKDLDGKQEKANDTYDLKLPKDAALSEDAVKEIKEFAKANELSAEAAQKLLNERDKSIKDFSAGKVEELKAMSQSWAEDVKRDKEIGGDNFNKNVELARRALEEFASPEFIKLLEDTGYGNHPELVRAFFKVGKRMANDSLILGRTKPPGQRPSHAEVLYGKSK